MQRSVHILASSARARLEEALLEVVTEECVQYGVHRRVRVAQTRSNQVDLHHELGDTFVAWREHHSDLRYPVG